MTRAPAPGAPTLEARGLTTRSLTGPAFERFVAEDVDRWAEWIRLAGIERQ